jgi:hypothetical protein
MDRWVIGADSLSKGTCLLQRVEIREVGVDVASGCLDLAGDGPSPLRITTVHEHVHAPLGKRQRHCPAEAGGRSRYQRDSGVVRHCPFGDRLSHTDIPCGSMPFSCWEYPTLGWNSGE